MYAARLRTQYPFETLNLNGDRTQYPYQTVQLGRLTNREVRSNSIIAVFVVGGATAGYLRGRKRFGAAVVGGAVGLIAGVVAALVVDPIGS